MSLPTHVYIGVPHPSVGVAYGSWRSLCALPLVGADVRSLPPPTKRAIDGEMDRIRALMRRERRWDRRVLAFIAFIGRTGSAHEYEDALNDALDALRPLGTAPRDGDMARALHALISSPEGAGYLPYRNAVVDQGRLLTRAECMDMLADHQMASQREREMSAYAADQAAVSALHRREGDPA